MNKRQKIRFILLLFFFLTFPLTINYLSPYLIVLGAATGVITGSFIVFIVLFISSLFLGRAYCGYVCPVSGFQDVANSYQKKSPKRGRRDYIKYAIWLMWFGLILVLIFTVDGLVKVNILYMTEDVISVSRPEAFVIYYAVLGLIFFINHFIGKRGFCHSYCWMAPFMVIGRKISLKLGNPRLKINRNDNECISCDKCSKVCPMTINVMELVRVNHLEDSECILCGECIVVCPKEVIQYEFNK